MDNIFMFITLFGGLALFLYGMNMMGSGLEKLAGGKLERIFEKLTSNIVKAILLGAGVTCIMQSSSATTVMLVGFVNSGIMKLRQAIGVIMGANIGTTITAWILSLSGIEGDTFFIRMLNPNAFSPIIAVIGIYLFMFSKKPKKNDIGAICLGFAILMTGMNIMSTSVEPLADVPQFQNLMIAFSDNPLLGVLAGTVLTGIIQSSSASVGILQALSATNAITFGTALPIILGQNIGTCVTAIISSIGTSKNAKRVACVHLYFNIIGTIIFLTAFYTLNSFIHFSFANSIVNEVQIAIVHTIFNITTTLILAPFAKLLEKLAFLTIKDSAEDIKRDEEFKLLDDRFLSSPSFAIEQCKGMTIRMAELTRETIKQAIEISHGYTEQLDLAIHENESRTDMYEDKLGTYLVKISAKDLSVSDGQNISTLLHCIGDFERISDHAANIVKVAKEKYDKNIEFSDKARKELEVVLKAIDEVVDLAIDAFINDDIEKAKRVEPLEEVIDQLNKKLKNRHILRLQEGTCTIELGFVFIDFLTNLERVSDHCSNIAVCLIQSKDANFDTHEYIHELKASGTEFDDMVKHYLEEYKLPAKAAL